MFTSAQLISPDSAIGGAPVLRGEILLDTGHGCVVSAVLRYSALGIVEARIGGVPVSGDLLTPGWSSYEWRVRVAETDVTSFFGPGTASRDVTLTLGNGWYRGDLTWMGASAVYGSELAGIAELEIGFADGHRQIWGTDTTWTSSPTDITSDDLYQGQTIDARRREDEPATAPVSLLDDDLARFEPYIGPPVRRQQEISPVSVWVSPSGRILVDFGQNLVGWVRVSAQGERGTTLTLRHAEVLEHGELAVRALRSAAAIDR